MTYFKVTGFKKGKTSKGLEYKSYTFEETRFVEKDANTFEEIPTGRKGTKTFFGNHKDDMKIGDNTDGEIVEFKTTPYTKTPLARDKKWLETVTVFVITGENGLEVAAKELSKYPQAFPLDENGKPYRLADQLLRNEGVE